MKEHRIILRTESDIFQELMEHEFVRDCKIKTDYLNSRAKIIVKLSVFDFVFRTKKRIDQIHSILRPKMPVTMGYDINIKPTLL